MALDLLLGIAVAAVVALALVLAVNSELNDEEDD